MIYACCVLGIIVADHGNMRTRPKAPTLGGGMVDDGICVS